MPEQDNRDPKRKLPDDIASRTPKQPPVPLKKETEQDFPDIRSVQAREVASAAAAAAVPVIKHKWTSADTYADLAFKYYGSIKEPYWRLIYNHNKAIIGNNPNDIRVGLEIEIPPLPEELKKK